MPVRREIEKLIFTLTTGAHKLAGRRHEFEFEVACHALAIWAFETGGAGRRDGGPFMIAR